MFPGVRHMECAYCLGSCRMFLFRVDLNERLVRTVAAKESGGIELGVQVHSNQASAFALTEGSIKDPLVFADLSPVSLSDFRVCHDQVLSDGESSPGPGNIVPDVFQCHEQGVVQSLLLCSGP